MKHTIRRSNRARHVWLRISHDGELIVVVPVGYDASRVPSLLEEKRLWIERASSRLRAQSAGWPADDLVTVPRTIRFEATGEEWTIQHRSCATERTTARVTGDGVLEVRGEVGHTHVCREALRRWLSRAARARLEPWIRQLAVESGFRVGRVSIRSQRTRWASCSRRGDISLNTRLLFVSPELVRHVLLHELCHTKHLNHSEKFWSLLERHDPACARHRLELRAAWGQTPSWLFGRNGANPKEAD